MPRKRRSEAQIVYALRQVEGGAKIGEVCRELGVTEMTYFRWKKQYAGLGMPELRRLKLLEDENATLKRFAPLSLSPRSRTRDQSSRPWSAGNFPREQHAVHGHLVFRVSPGPADNLSYDWAYWARIEIR